MGAVAAAAVLHKERHIVAAYEAAGALSPASARPPAALGVREGVALRRLRARAVLREAEAGALYLDLPSWMALQAIRRRVLVTVLLLGLAVMVIVLLARR